MNRREMLSKIKNMAIGTGLLGGAAIVASQDASAEVVVEETKVDTNKTYLFKRHVDFIFLLHETKINDWFRELESSYLGEPITDDLLREIKNETIKYYESLTAELSPNFPFFKMECMRIDCDRSRIYATEQIGLRIEYVFENHTPIIARYYSGIVQTRFTVSSDNVKPGVFMYGFLGHVVAPLTEPYNPRGMNK
jgi:hypothetical protein